jgi:flavin reductase (DIM6/NTAB) family NADH-FMN oxidoreductase RutF
MRTFATGVCVATTYADRENGRHHDAVTINSLTSVSLDPPLVSMCLRRGSAFLDDLLASRRWAVSILHGAADDVARRFAAGRATRAAEVPGLRATPGARTGALVLDAAGWLECTLWEQFAIGDHVMVVGEVVAAGVRRHERPLIFLHGRYLTTGVDT